MNSFSKRIVLNFSKRIVLNRMENGHYVSVPATVYVHINIDELVQLLGSKALDNKSHATRLLKGIITARATREKKETTT